MKLNIYAFIAIHQISQPTSNYITLCVFPSIYLMGARLVCFVWFLVMWVWAQWWRYF